jgi:hypothetical protein
MKMEFVKRWPNTVSNYKVARNLQGKPWIFLKDN